MKHSNDPQSQCLTEDLRKIEIKKAVEENFPENSDLHKLKDESDDIIWDYEEILKILGFGKTQWLLLLTIGLLTMNAIAAVYSIGIIGIASQCEFNITQKERGIMMASCVIGISLSTYFWGFMSDVWGRRKVLIWSMCLSNILQFILMFVTNIWIFNFINLIMGISLGGTLGPKYPYIGEFNITKYRAIVINYCNMFVSFSAMYVPAISWLVLSFDWSYQITTTFIFKPWRLIMLFSMLPGLTGTLLLLNFPESPKLLLAHGKQNEAFEVLDWISKYNTGKDLKTILNTSTIHLKSEELADIQLLSIGKGISILSNIWKATVPLFQKPHGTRVVMAVIAFLSLVFWASGMQLWFPEIVNRLTAYDSQSQNSSTLCEILIKSYQDKSKNQTIQLCDDTVTTKTFINNIIMGFTLFVAFNLQGPLLKFLGRKIVLFSCLIMGVLCGILLNFITYTMGIIILLYCCILVPVLATSNMISVVVDLVPTHLRGKAVCFGFTMGRVGTIIATNLIGVMLTSHCSGIFILMLCMFLTCIGIVYFLPI